MNEELTSKDGRTVLRMERALNHPPEKVWRALTEPSELAGWFPAAVELDLRLDGAISFTFTEGEDDFIEDPDNTGVIRAYDPPRLLEFNWGAEIQRWELTPTADGCLLILTTTYDDRPGSASFTSGWIMCFDALEMILGGGQVPDRDYAELHEHFIKAYGLDKGQILEDGSLRFERQLTAPKETVWEQLAGAENVPSAALPPAGFVAKGIEPGAVRAWEAPSELSYEWQRGLVTFKLRDWNGRGRLVLTQTGPAKEFLEPWQDLIESLARDLTS